MPVPTTKEQIVAVFEAILLYFQSLQKEGEEPNALIVEIGSLINKLK